MPGKKYIGVFDSGVGGVSVLRELMALMPQEDSYYFGDSANAPYGPRPTAQVRQLSIAAAEHLLEMGAKCLVVACNTATAAAITDLREAYPDRIIVRPSPSVFMIRHCWSKRRSGASESTPRALSWPGFATSSG